MTRLALLMVVVASPLPSRADAPPVPRAARSVHLHFPAPAAEAFYNEVTVEKSAPGSYFMACGFRHGYFGMQELSGGRKVVLFSVWDPTKGDEAAKVPLEQRVEVLHQGPDVEVKRFGGEGTGGQSFFKYDWKVGETCRFLVRAKIEGEKSAYSAYFYLPRDKAWKHLVTFRTRTGGDRLAGLYSFIEDFRRDTKSAGEVRRASFGNGWVLDGEWKPLLTARFTASSSEWEAEDTIDAGMAGKAFYLQTGGDTRTTTPLNGRIERPPGGTAPADLPAD